MGRIDDRTDIYFDDERRFADIFNGYLFNGRQIISPEDLEEADRINIVKYKDDSYKAVSDKTKLWKGKYLHLLVLENQTYIDYRMVMRNMLLESVNYHKQWKKMRNNHRYLKDLKEDEFLSGISKDDKFIPVVILVINLSDKKWDASKDLYGLLDVNGDDEILKYINNYKINIFDYHDYDDYDMFKTELKNLFEFIKYSNDKTIINERMSNDERYKCLDEDTVKLIEDISKIKVEIVGGTGNMCKAFEDYREEGREEGRINYFISAMIKKFHKGKTLDQIADELEIPVDEIKGYYCLIANNSSATPDEIYRLSISNK